MFEDREERFDEEDFTPFIERHGILRVLVKRDPQGPVQARFYIS